MSEDHKVRIVVQLRSVKLKVRFPCKLTFELRTDASRQESEIRHELTNGLCLANETMELETYVSFDASRRAYQDHKVMLFVKMISNSGTIPAGNVSFNPFTRQPLDKKQCLAQLQKCPDKSAFIEFVYYYQLLNVHEGSKSQLIKNSSFTHNMMQSTSYAMLRSAYNDEYKLDRVKSSILRETPKRILTPREEPFDTFNKSQVEQRVAREDFVKDRSRVIQTINFDLDYGTHPNNKMEQQRQLARLRAQTKILRGDGMGQRETRLKEENLALTNQLDRARQRIRSFERQQRQISLQQRESKDEIQRLRERIASLQSLKVQRENELRQKEKILKETQSQSRKWETNCKQLQAQLSTISKKLEYRQTNFQQQLEKYYTKLSASQQQKQRLILEQNNILSTLEEAQKKHQATLKEKQRAHAQHRSNIQKINESLTSQLQSCSNNLIQKTKQIEQLKQKLTDMVQAEQKSKAKIGQLVTELDTTRRIVKKEQEQCQHLRSQILELQEVANEKVQLKKRNSQLLTEVSKATEKYERLLSENKFYLQKIKASEQGLAEKTEERDALNKKNLILQEKLDSLKSQKQRIIKQYQTLTDDNISLEKKHATLISQFESQKKQRGSLSQRYQHQNLNLSKQRQLLLCEIDQLKENVAKLKDELSILTKKNMDLNTNNLQMNEQIIVLKEAVKRQLDKRQEQEQRQNYLKSQLSEAEKREKYLSSQLKNKDQELYTLNKKIKMVENQLFHLKEKCRQLETQGQSLKDTDQLKLKQKDKTIAKQSEQLLSISFELTAIKEEFAISNNSLLLKGTENSQLKAQIQDLRQEINIKDLQCKEKSSEINNLQEIVERLTASYENLKLINKEVEQAVQRIKKEFDLYKSDSTLALTNFLKEIGKEQAVEVVPLKCFDPTISLMQNEALKRINATNTRNATKIMQLQQEKSGLSEGLKVLKAEKQQLQKRYESQIKQKLFQFQQRLRNCQKEQELLLSKLQQQEQANNRALLSIQKLNNELFSKDELILELRTEITKMLEQLESSYKDLRAAQQNLLAFKANDIKQRVTIQANTMELLRDKEAEIKQLNATIQDYEKKIDIVEKIVKDKEQTIRNNQSSLLQMQYRVQISQEQTKECQDKLAKTIFESRQIKKQVQNLQKENKSINNMLLEYKSNQEHMLVKYQQLQNQLKHSQQSLTESQLKLQKVKAEIQLLKRVKADLELRLTQKEEICKQISERQAHECSRSKEKIIELTSLSELNQFQLQQQQAEIQHLTQQFKGANGELIRRKQEITVLHDKINELSNRNLVLNQTLSSSRRQKTDLVDENKRLREMRDVFENELNLLQSQIEGYQQKDREIDRLKMQLQGLQYEIIKFKRMQGYQSTINLNSYRRHRNTTPDEKANQQHQTPSKDHVNLTVERAAATQINSKRNHLQNQLSLQGLLHQEEAIIPLTNQRNLRISSTKVPLKLQIMDQSEGI